MIQVKEFPDRVFQNKEDLFKALKENKSTVLAAKKASIKTHVKSPVLGFYSSKSNSIKSIPNMEDGFIYPVISNTNYFDNHQDVHLNGSMTKTAREQNKKVYYVDTHSLTVNDIIAAPEDVEVMLLTLPWKDLGKNYEGYTEALIFKIDKTQIIHDKFLRVLKKGIPLQNSIRMEYVKIDLGINTEQKGYEDEKSVFDEIYPTVVNKQDVDEYGYLYAVRELKMRMEGSAVLFGSNDATPIQSKEIQEAGQPLQNNKREPEESTFDVKSYVQSKNYLKCH